jgi:mono/diheme cytochrome c family protein
MTHEHEQGPRRSRRGPALALAWLLLAIRAWAAESVPSSATPLPTPGEEKPPETEATASEDVTREEEPASGDRDRIPAAAGGEEAPAGFALAGDAERGRAIFAKSCAICHGVDGSGHGRIALDPPARDLRDASRMEKRSDWEVYRVIRDGGKILDLSPRMVPWGSILDDQEIHDVGAYVRFLAEGDAGDTE